MVERLVLASLCLTSFVEEAWPQEEADVTFEEMVGSLDTHRTMYGTNKRVVGTSKRYDIAATTGQFAATLSDDRDFELVRDAAGNWRFTVTASRIHPDSTNIGFYSTPEIYFGVLRDGDQYAIKDFVARGSNPSNYLRQTASGPGDMASSFDGQRGLALTAHYLKDGSRVTHKFAVTPPAWATRFGRDVIAVTSDLTPKGELAGRAGGPVHQTSYFDPANSFVYLGSESSETPSVERPWKHSTTCALEYEARPGTYPIPKRFTRYVQPDKGEKLLEYEVVYTRFEDYVPDADDFRLEKRYGLTTPAGPDWKPPVAPQPPESPHAWAWRVALVAVAAVAAVVAVTALRYASRHSSFRL